MMWSESYVRKCLSLELIVYLNLNRFESEVCLQSISYLFDSWLRCESMDNWYPSWAQKHNQSNESLFNYYKFIRYRKKNLRSVVNWSLTWKINFLYNWSKK